MAKPKPKRKKNPAAEINKPLSLEYLTMAWSQEPLSPPPDLAEELDGFDNWARSHSDLSRSQIDQRITRLLMGWIQQHLCDWTDWLLRPCTSDMQRQKILFATDNLAHDPLPRDNPLIGFWMRQWAQHLPLQQAQWLPLWLDSEAYRPWPDLSPEVVEKWAGEMGQATLPPALPLDQVYPWLCRYSHLLGWALAPEEIVHQRSLEALTWWLEVHPNVYAGHHPLAQWYALSEAARQLERVLSIYGWEAYLWAPHGADWCIELGQALAAGQRYQEAYDCLLQAEPRGDVGWAVAAALTEVGLYLDLDPDILQNHLQDARSRLADPESSKLLDHLQEQIATKRART